jgi:hypothetical protein
VGDPVLLLVNAGSRPRSFALPALGEAGGWEPLANTATPTGAAPRRSRRHVMLPGKALSLLCYRSHA